ncbi:Gfo/Idh/MocA family protein [Ruicaihuangia caeni]|uniref:Gfo/Idh/MocA family oxidoreductase n=1 Tax=Ruicaihuangia caeni TaxID=3042517 RepID=A0AAW6TAK5_9MICO|nr:Gfo/Idh/MocA family oxidoreductase [Klugiella sp. YN-L-19]MDI2099008.1 Gfo/Idh/MocA family oxidoreductase [Klugiella sp. YN-L-19]
MSERSRAVIIGAGHWHFELYQPGWSRHHDIAGVVDDDESVARARAAILGARAWTDLGAMLDEAGRIDVAYVLGRHASMPWAAAELVRRGIPFVLEKPGASNLRDLRELSSLARRANVPAAAALVQRFGPLPALAQEVGEVQHARYSFLAGPPERYIDSGNPWMMQRNESGGGCLALLGVHFADMFLHTQYAHERSHDDVTVRSSVSNAMHGRRVDDHATALLRTPSGRSATIEVGWTFPAGAPLQRLVSYVLTGSEATAVIDTEGNLSVISRDGTVAERHVDVEADNLYPLFVERVHESLERGFAGLPTLDDLTAAMGLISRAYVDAAAGYAVDDTAWQAASLQDPALSVRR